MLTHPQFDPVALQIGPLAIRWYGLMYLVAFTQFLLLGRMRIAQRQPGQPLYGLTGKDIEDLMFYGVLGAVIGGRLGHVHRWRSRFCGLSSSSGCSAVTVARSRWPNTRSAPNSVWPIPSRVSARGAPAVPEPVHCQRCPAWRSGLFCLL